MIKWKWMFHIHWSFIVTLVFFSFFSFFLALSFFLFDSQRTHNIKKISMWFCFHCFAGYSNDTSGWTNIVNLAQRCTGSGVFGRVFVWILNIVFDLISFFYILFVCFLSPSSQIPHNFPFVLSISVNFVFLLTLKRYIWNYFNLLIVWKLDFVRVWCGVVCLTISIITSERKNLGRKFHFLIAILKWNKLFVGFFSLSRCYEGAKTKLT